MTDFQDSSVEFMGRTVAIRSNPKRKRMAIHVAEGNVELRVPMRYSRRGALEFLEQNKAWIERTLARTSALEKTDKYADGSSVCFLGDEHRLAVKMGDEYSCRLEDGKFDVTLKDNDVLGRSEATRLCLEGWFIHQGRIYLPPRTMELAQRVGVKPRAVTVGKSKSAWGTCSRNGRIRFSWHLMQAPRTRVDSVIIHELCHMIEHNHSEAFWRLVEKHDPEFKDHNRWFRAEGHLLLR